MPNLYPYDAYSAVAIMTDEHVVPLEGFQRGDGVGDPAPLQLDERPVAAQQQEVRAQEPEVHQVHPRQNVFRLFLDLHHVLCSSLRVLSENLADRRFSGATREERKCK